MKRLFKALLVTPKKRQVLAKRLERLNLNVSRAANCKEVQELLRSDGSFEIAMTDVTLADGKWSDVLTLLVDAHVPASLIVVSREADVTLWSEVLWLGGYDLLVEPCKYDEVCEVVEGGLRAAERLQAATLALGADVLGEKPRMSGSILRSGF